MRGSSLAPGTVFSKACLSWCASVGLGFQLGIERNDIAVVMQWKALSLSLAPDSPECLFWASGFLSQSRSYATQKETGTLKLATTTH